MKVLQIIIILAGCGTICFGIISAVILVPTLFAETMSTALLPFAGYLILTAVGAGIMLLAKRLSP